ESDAEKVAEYYFDRIIQNYDDLLVKDKSLHIISLQNLIKMSDSPENKVSYYNALISQFGEELNITELYLRLAQEYEAMGDWELALKSYASFLERPDATTIQIPGISDPYNTAKKLVDFNNSPKNQTFETLEALETAIKRAIDTRN
ncbi:MAG TPA: tetratricopeptide repeat protein, partial [Treponema sp.]|nr:tetratricopeptide repeat protein [Treponema sp.]